MIEMRTEHGTAGRRAMIAGVALFAALVAVGPTAAGERRTIDRTVEARANGVVSVELISGRVDVVGWDRNEVRVRGDLGRDVEEVEVDVDDGEVSIEVELHSGKNLRDAGADLTIHVPRRSSLEIESISAGLSVEGVVGQLELESVSGSVSVRGARGEAEIATVSGRIELHADGPIEDVELSSVSGRIEFVGELHGKGDYSFESVSGAIAVELVGEISADFSVETFSGSIDNSFGPAPRRQKYVPSQSLSFTEGGGAADVSIESFSGRVTLQRR